jgi:hypothetical protein
VWINRDARLMRDPVEGCRLAPVGTLSARVRASPDKSGFAMPAAHGNAYRYVLSRLGISRSTWRRPC